MPLLYMQMTTRTTRRFTAMVLIALLASIGAPGARTADSGDVPSELAQWRQQRVAALTSEKGFLTPVGLYWPDAGRSSFGRSKNSTFVLDHPAMPARAGEFLLSGATLEFVAARRSRVLHDGQPVSRIALAPDTSGKPTILSLGTLQFFAIERDGRLGIRVRDTDSVRRREFPGLQYSMPMHPGNSTRASSPMLTRTHPDHEHPRHGARDAFARRAGVRA